MKFQKNLYPYQNEILSVFEKEREKREKKIHIVAPPGSGKTIIGCEILTRIAKPTLILVPNLTLLEQWQDKLEKLFFESGETADSIISTSIDTIKYINILTYQSLAGTDEQEDENIQVQIYTLWYESEKSEFSSKEVFLNFVHQIKIEAPDEYKDEYTKHRKKLKNSGVSNTTRTMMRDKIFEYTRKLRDFGIGTMIVDEAHHLTSWWSHVLFEIWEDLQEPYIIGLTATPPFDNVDYFELDESYTKLLGSVDYFVPTPAIVRSGRLAPYSDLLYIVKPGKELEETLVNGEMRLAQFLEANHEGIVKNLHEFLLKNYERLKIKSGDICDKWMRFIYRYKTPEIDMTPYIHGGINHTLSLEDIAKSIGKWASDSFKKDFNSESHQAVKSLFFDLGYIWRGANFYRFETPLEKGLIYAKSKIEGVRAILQKEEQNLGSELRVAIITDFLDAESDWINCHSIFDEVAKSFSHLSPYIVSGQGIWKLENGIKIAVENESILTVTEKLLKGEIQLVIGTRGILGEGWDCPVVNTLIDLTGVSAYMSVNQVRGRAIRLDQDKSEKVANIYDIVCIGEGYQGLRDFERIEKKHEQFYGVDDAGLIIKGLDHIYPQLQKNIRYDDKINNYTLKKSALRSMVKELWNIGEEFKNEEIFSLSLEITHPFEVYPLNENSRLFDVIMMDPKKESSSNVLEIGKTKYHKYMRNWVKKIIDGALQALQFEEIVPLDFGYTLTYQDNGSITILSNHSDALISKYFLEVIGEIFEPITNQKYKYQFHTNIEQLVKDIYDTAPTVAIPLSLITMSTLIISTLGFIPPTIALESIIIALSVPGIIIPFYAVNSFMNKKAESLKNMKNVPIEFPLPNIISSNETKRNFFLGKSTPKGWKWFFHRMKKLDGEILPVEKTDIGKTPIFTAKIEKLWR